MAQVLNVLRHVQTLNSKFTTVFVAGAVSESTIIIIAVVAIIAIVVIVIVIAVYCYKVKNRYSNSSS